MKKKNQDIFCYRYSNDLVPYDEAVAYMDDYIQKIIDEKAKSQIWFLEHDSLFTYGTSAKQEELLNHNKFPVYKSGRGGKFTYHGPGMRIIYLMLDLTKQNKIGRDVRKYVFNLEQVVINSLECFGIKGERRDNRIGIWVCEENGIENKIAAIGIRIKRWVAYHGIAININPNLENFSGIIPCGISDSNYGVTSFWELGKKITLSEFDEVFSKEFHKIFL